MSNAYGGNSWDDQGDDVTRVRSEHDADLLNPSAPDAAGAAEQPTAPAPSSEAVFGGASETEAPQSQTNAESSAHVGDAAVEGAPVDAAATEGTLTAGGPSESAPADAVPSAPEPSSFAQESQPYSDYSAHSNAGEYAAQAPATDAAPVGASNPYQQSTAGASYPQTSTDPYSRPSGTNYPQHSGSVPQQPSGAPEQHGAAPYQQPAGGAPYQQYQQQPAGSAGGFAGAGAPAQGLGPSRMLVGLLGIFFGGFGVHRFMLGYTTIGIIQIAVSLVTCGLGAWWGVIEGILVLAKHQSFITDAQGRPLAD